MLNKTLSIIIVNYRSSRCLKKNLASIQDKIKIEPEIIVVNNDEAEDLTELQNIYPRLKIIEHKKNIGLGAGANLGFKHCSGDILLFLNPDTEILSDGIEAVLAEFSQDSKLGILGSGLVMSDGKRQSWSAGYETGLIDILRNNLKIPKSKKIWKSKEKRYVDWVSGTALFMRKTTYQKLNGFDERFFMYFEDMDLCKRTSLVGERVLYFPEFEVRHTGGESYAGLNSQKKDYFESLAFYFKKHYSSWHGKLIKFLGLAFNK
jgi:hypothetical protein